MGESVTPVIIYLGRSVPTYVLMNLERIHRLFPANPPIFISDNQDSLQKARKKGVATWDATNSSQKAIGVLEGLLHDLNFRKGFWQHTLARLLVLCDFIRITNMSNVLQIESDVIILESFPWKTFAMLENCCAYGLEGHERGIASLLYITSPSEAEKLSKFIDQEVKLNPGSTDMTVLGQYYKEASDSVVILPSLGSRDWINDSSKGVPLSCLISNSKFVGIFDPITIGMHFFGEDARNHRGRRRYGRVQSHHYLNPKTLVFGLDRYPEIRIGNKGEKGLLLYSLHNHSKDKRLFREKISKQIWEQSILDASGKKSKLDLRAFAEMTLSFFNRKWKSLR